MLNRCSKRVDIHDNCHYQIVGIYPFETLFFSEREQQNPLFEQISTERRNEMHDLQVSAPETKSKR